AEPRDVREGRVRRPESLGARHTLTGVFESAGHRLAVLEVDGGGLRGQVADAVIGTAIEPRVGGTVYHRQATTDSGQDPSELRRFLHRVVTGVQFLTILVAAARRVTGECEAVVARTSGPEAEATRLRLCVLHDD